MSDYALSPCPHWPGSGRVRAECHRCFDQILDERDLLRAGIGMRAEYERAKRDGVIAGLERAASRCDAVLATLKNGPIKHPQTALVRDAVAVMLTDIAAEIRALKEGKDG